MAGERLLDLKKNTKRPIDSNDATIMKDKPTDRGT